MADDGLSAGREDLMGSIAGMVGYHWGTGSLLPAVEAGKEPLLLMGYGDATGGWRAASVTHYETGIASWAARSSVSKLTLLPSHMHEGDDHAPNLRTHGKIVFDGWQKLINAKALKFFPRTSADLQIAKETSIDFRMAGDFQIIKSVNNMSLYTSPIWCECDSTAINFWPSEPLSDWAAVLNHFTSPGDGIVPCVVKTLKRSCSLSGWSHEVLMGKPFAPFDCGCACSRQHSWPTRSAWDAFVRKVLEMEHAQYKAFVREWGGKHSRHYPGYAPTLWDDALGMMLFSADILHLAYINYYKMHLEVLIFDFLIELSEEAREPVEVFLHSKGVPIKIAKAANMQEMSSSLTGCDAKVLCEKSSEIIPELLNWAHAPQEAVEQAAKEVAQEVRKAKGGGKAASTVDKSTAKVMNGAMDNVFTMRRPRSAHAGQRDADDADDADDDVDDDVDDADEADGAAADADDAEAQEDLDAKEKRKITYAGYMDDFNRMVFALRPFERDDAQYREERATELFNAGAKCDNNMKTVRTNFDSAVPHVMTHIITRQMVADGDPNRRSCEQSEAIGVDIKFDLHNRWARILELESPALPLCERG